MAYTTSTKGSGNTNNDGGSIFGTNNTASSRFANYSLVTNNTKHQNISTLPYQGYSVTQAVKGGAVTITAITQSGSTGYTNIQKSSHGLSVGSAIEVYGSNVAGYNRVHIVTVVTDSNNVQTNVKYSANTTTHGSYKLLSGNYGVLDKFIAPYICDKLAGSTTSVARIPCNRGQFRPVQISTGDRRWNITSWNYVTGAATKGANAGDLVGFIQTQGGGALTAEPMPNPRSLAAGLTYDKGAANPYRDTYKLRTQ